MERVARGAAVMTLALIVTACGGPAVAPSPAGRQATSGTRSVPSAAPAPSTSANPLPSRAPGVEFAGVERAPFGDARFSDPTTIDNQWLPLRPGRRLVFEGEVNGDEERLEHQVVFTVTDLTKTIGGVETRVAYDLDYTDGELVEAELAFFAQDDEGNVWHIGQFPQEYEGGQPGSTPTWINGIADANAGVLMPAEPPSIVGSWSQGWAPAVDYNDRAKLFESGSQTCVPAGCYEHVLVFDEFNPGEPDVHQLKYYAPGIGNVRVGWAGAMDDEQEVLELVEIVDLDAGDLSRIRDEALALEGRAYEVSSDVYGLTSPAALTRAGT